MMNLGSKVILIIVCLMITINSLRLHEKQINSDNLGNTKLFLADSYNYFVSDNDNRVWAGALTLAWQQLNNNILKDSVKIESKDKIVNKIVENFNNCPFKKDALKPSNYYIKSGFGQSTVDTINKQVKQKFPNKTTPDLDTDLAEKDIVSFAYLSKQFEYPIKFTADPYFIFKKETIPGFKADSIQQKNQVKYHYYQSPQEFLVKLSTKDPNQEVYLLRTKDNQNQIKNIIAQVMKWQKSPALSLIQNDMFSMPVIDLDYYREIHQLSSVNLINKGFEDYSFSKVFEALKLKVDETGVKIENEGGIIMVRGALISQKPKQFILNDTFWIVLKQVDKDPYLCIKVNKPVDKQRI